MRRYHSGTEQDEAMSNKKPPASEPQPELTHLPKAPGSKKVGKPDWAQGLRQLYDSVVEEPLPDTFRELLSRLDK